MVGVFCCNNVLVWSSGCTLVVSSVHNIDEDMYVLPTTLVQVPKYYHLYNHFLAGP